MFTGFLHFIINSFINNQILKLVIYTGTENNKKIRVSDIPFTKQSIAKPMIKMGKNKHTTYVKSHTAHWFFMSREVGHNTITVRILAHKYLYKNKEANAS